MRLKIAFDTKLAQSGSQVPYLNELEGVLKTHQILLTGNILIFNDLIENGWGSICLTVEISYTPI